MDNRLLRHFITDDTLQIWYKNNYIGGIPLFQMNVNTGVRKEIKDEQKQQIIEDSINSVIEGKPTTNFAPRYFKLKKKGVL
jgi:hypothetical protein